MSKPIVDEASVVLAEDSDTLLAAAMDYKVTPVVLKGSELRKRPVKITRNGEVVRVEPHGKVLDGLARREVIQTATQDGRRPDLILCIECKAPREVKRGPLPKHCKSCGAKAKREAKRKSRAANPEARREADRKYRAANPEAKREAKRKYRARKKAEREAEKAKSK